MKRQSHKKGRKGSCSSLLLWITLITVGVLLVVFFVLSSLFDLGLWEEFWDLFRD